MLLINLILITFINILGDYHKLHWPQTNNLFPPPLPYFGKKYGYHFTPLGGMTW